MIPLETGPLTVKKKKEEPEVQQQEPEVRQPAVKMTPAVLVPRERELPVVKLYQICELLKIKKPPAGSEKEKLLRKELKNIYKNLGRYYHDRADAKVLPLVVKERRKANVPREQKWREDVRHAVSYVVTLVVMPILGGIGTLFANIADAFYAMISHAPLVMGMGLFVTIATFIIKAWQYSQTTQALSVAVVLNIIGWGLLFGGLAALAVGLLEASYKYLQAQREERQAEQTLRVE